MSAAAARHGSRARAVGTAALCALVVAMLGGLSTDIGTWYAGLQRPPWQPPDLWFGPAWTLIYSLAALSAASAWRAEPHPRQRQSLIVLWLLNAVLNLGWSLLFFRLQRPDWALFEVLLLWLSIAHLIVWSWPRSRVAAGLLVPYLLWVSFAAALNRAVVQLNGPFGPG